MVRPSRQNGLRIPPYVHYNGLAHSVRLSSVGLVRRCARFQLSSVSDPIAVLQWMPAIVLIGTLPAFSFSRKRHPQLHLQGGARHADVCIHPASHHLADHGRRPDSQLRAALPHARGDLHIPDLHQIQPKVARPVNVFQLACRSHPSRSGTSDRRHRHLAVVFRRPKQGRAHCMHA